MKVKEIPKLGEGEKIRINLGSSKRKSPKAAKGEKKSSGGPFLLKKPPTFASNAADVTSGKPGIILEGMTGESASVEPNSTMPPAGETDDDFGDDWNDFQEATPKNTVS